jgi:DNA polymerase III delta prime subunit
MNKNLPWHELLALLISKQAATKILLWGPPDTGKTTSAVRLAKSSGKALFRLQCSCEQGIEDLLGSMTLKQGETQFAPGPIPRALASGGVLCLDEFDLRNPAHDSIYHSILDNAELASVTLPTGEVIDSKPGTMVIATMNGTPEDLTPALLRRFDVLIHVPSPHPDALCGVPENHKRALLQWSASAKVPDYAGPRSVSAMRSFSRLVSAGVDEVQAASLIFGAKQGREVLAVLAQNA